MIRHWCNNPECTEYMKEHTATTYRQRLKADLTYEWTEPAVCPVCGREHSYTIHDRAIPYDISLDPEDRMKGGGFASLDDAGKKAVLKKRYRQLNSERDLKEKKRATIDAIKQNSFNHHH